jgi:2'-5' RNA ligase
MRAFIAIAPDTVLRETLQQRVRPLAQLPGEGVRLLPAGNYHLTLLFLGAIRESSLDSITQALAQVVARWSPFAIRLDGIDLFPDPRRPRVLAAKISPNPPLHNLRRHCLAALQRQGVAVNAGRFRPHISLARIDASEARAARPLAEHYRTAMEAMLPVTALTLYQSQLHATGAIYRSLATFELSVD